MNEIKVYRNSPYEFAKQEIPHTAISSVELRSWISSGAIFSHLFRYQTSTLITYDLRLITKPFFSAVLMRLLARKRAVCLDRNGKSERITSLLIGRLFVRFLKDWIAQKKFIRKMDEQVLKLSQKLSKKKLDFSRPAVYLRTDFCFGLTAGGSVGHIAGVLNQLEKFTPTPIFLTTDPIPTVHSHIETHILDPGNVFWDFTELPPLYFNEVFMDQATRFMNNRIPSFIYQRYSMNNFSGIHLARHYQAPLVLEFNGSEIWVNKNWGDYVLKYESLAEKIEMLNLQQADLIVVVSKPLQDQLVAKGIDEKRILVNPNGVDTDKYSPAIDGSSIRKKLRLENKIVLGFIGTFGKWHGAENLVEAFSHLLENHPKLKGYVHLLLVGDGLTMPNVKAMICDKMLGDFCTLTGTVPQEKGPLYLAACDILVASHVPNADGSAFFGSPTKLFEYMAMGKGIVASDLDQIGEILEHNSSAYLVKPGDVGSLSLGLKALIDDPQLRKRLGDKAREMVVKRHSWKEHTRKIIEKLVFLNQVENRDSVNPF